MAIEVARDIAPALFDGLDIAATGVDDASPVAHFRWTRCLSEYNTAAGVCVDMFDYIVGSYREGWVCRLGLVVC